MPPTGLTVTRSGFAPLFPLLRGRLVDLRPIAGKIAASIRDGGVGSIADSFKQQRHYLPTGAYVPWTPSLRALEERNLTLVDSGAYRRAWLGKGPGAITNIEARRVRVGVRRSRFPQVGPFQADSATMTGRGLKTRLVPRPVGMNAHILERIKNLVLRYVATGKS